MVQIKISLTNMNANKYLMSVRASKVVPLTDTTTSSKQELDLLFGTLYDEFFTAGTSCVNKSSSPTKNSPQQGTPPLATAQSTTELITPTTTITAEDNILIPAKSDSLPHAHAQTTKTYYKHQDSRIKKAQVLKTKTSAKSDIKDPSSETNLQGRLLASFQKDAKYEHVGQDTRSQGGKDDQDKQRKDLKISKSKTKSKDNDKG
ncbi:hypothetical protein Tco_0441268 [Tanacetum coccineum]